MTTKATARKSIRKPTPRTVVKTTVRSAAKPAVKATRFDTAVSTVRETILRLVRKNDVSSVDLINVVPSFDGPSRSAVISTAFNRLVNENRIRRTADTIYNPSTKNRVAVYSNVKV